MESGNGDRRRERRRDPQAVVGLSARRAGELDALSSELGAARTPFWALDVNDRAKSVILLNPTGRGNTLHPMKPLADDDPIVLGIKAWVDAEQ